MRKHLTIGTALSLLLASAAAAPASAQENGEALHDPGPDEHLVYEADDVQWQDGPASLAPGAEFAVLEGDPTRPGIFTMRIRMPDGYRIDPHWHPKPERVSVVSGTFHLGAGETVDPDATLPLGAGGYTAIPPGMRHWAIAEGETVIQLTSTGPWEITYVRPEEDPRQQD